MIGRLKRWLCPTCIIDESYPQRLLLHKLDRTGARLESILRDVTEMRETASGNRLRDAALGLDDDERGVE